MARKGGVTWPLAMQTYMHIRNFPSDWVKPLASLLINLCFLLYIMQIIVFLYALLLVLWDALWYYLFYIYKKKFTLKWQVFFAWEKIWVHQLKVKVHKSRRIMVINAFSHISLPLRLFLHVCCMQQALVHSPSFLVLNVDSSMMLLICNWMILMKE